MPSWNPAQYLRPHLRARPVLDMASYQRLLEPLAASLDIWETTYLHRLEGEDAVLEWTKGSALRPILDRLADSERDAFLERYRARIRRAYPPERDGTTLFAFRRLFLVATKQGR